MGQQLSLDKDKIRFLLLEGVHQTALDTLSSAGYSNIEYLKTALDEDALIEKSKMHTLWGFVHAPKSLSVCLKPPKN
jgi:hypothetical protein